MKTATRAGAASIFVILCLTVLGVIGIVGVVTEAEANEGASECFGCYPYDQLCPGGGHLDRTSTSAPWWTGGTIHSSCVPGDCQAGGHTTQGCIQTLAATEELDAALPLLARKQWAALATFMSESRTARFNAERGALQFTGCGNTIVAHIPVAGDDALRLRQEIANAVND